MQISLSLSLLAKTARDERKRVERGAIQAEITI
jgi:hypothetical protein